MKAISIANDNTPHTVLTANSFGRFASIFNNGAATIYIQYDSDPTTLSTANGYPILPNQGLTFENPDDSRPYQYAISAINNSGAAVELRVQSA